MSQSRLSRRSPCSHGSVKSSAAKESLCPMLTKLFGLLLLQERLRRLADREVNDGRSDSGEMEDGGSEVEKENGLRLSPNERNEKEK